MIQSKTKSINPKGSTALKYLDMIFLLILIFKSGSLKLIQTPALKHPVNC